MRKLAGEDGEVRYSEFMKFATPTDLCKIDHVRGGFAKAEDPDQKAAKKEAKKSSAAKEKVSTKSTVESCSGVQLRPPTHLRCIFLPKISAFSCLPL